MAVDAWSEKALVSITKIGGTDVEFCTKTTSIDISGGGQDTETVRTFCGDITRLNPQEPFEISLDVVPVYADDFDSIYFGGTDTTQPLEFTAGTSRDKYRVVILWTTDTTVTSATAATTAGEEAYRLIFAECYAVSFDKTYDADGYLQGTITFKCSAKDKSGDPNVAVQSDDGSGTGLAALNPYTSTTKW